MVVLSAKEISSCPCGWNPHNHGINLFNGTLYHKVVCENFHSYGYLPLYDLTHENLHGDMPPPIHGHVGFPLHKVLTEL